jgi:hypothetical protein
MSKSETLEGPQNEILFAHDDALAAYDSEYVDHWAPSIDALAVCWNPPMLRT